MLWRIAYQREYEGRRHCWKRERPSDSSTSSHGVSPEGCRERQVNALRFVYTSYFPMAVDLANPQWKSSVVENFTVAFLLQNLSSPFSLKVFGCWPCSSPPSMHCRLFFPTVHFKRIHPLKHLYTVISDFWRQFLVFKKHRLSIWASSTMTANGRRPCAQRRSLPDDLSQPWSANLQKSIRTNNFHNLAVPHHSQRLSLFRISTEGRLPVPIPQHCLIWPPPSPPAHCFRTIIEVT